MTAVFAHYTSEQLTQIHALEEQLTARGAIERRAMEDSEELSYDRVKFASLLAAHSRSDLPWHVIRAPIFHGMSMWLCIHVALGSLSGYLASRYSVCVPR